jgi:hypothetical protein
MIMKSQTNNAMDFQEARTMTGQGSAGNVIAALCSLWCPGLGQLVQGRPLVALIHFVLAIVLWIVVLGWLVHLWSTLDAAWYQRRF